MRAFFYAILAAALAAVVFSSAASDCSCFSEEVNESLRKCAALEEKAKSRSMFSKILIGGDFESGRQMQNASGYALAMVEGCGCDAERQLIKCSAIGAVEEKRSGLFGWFRGFI